MKKRSRNIKVENVEKSDLIKSLTSLSLEEVDKLQKTIPTLLQSKLQQMSTSDDLTDIMKANLYLDGESKRSNGKVKSVFFDPDSFSDAGRGYKDPRGFGSLSFDTLRRMGDIFIVRSVVNTRVEQVQNFLHFSLDEQKAGYTIRKKRSLFDEKSQKTTKEDQKKIEYIVDFLENGGITDKWDNRDSFQDFGRKIIFDTLTLDQLSFECVRSRSQELCKFRAIDASLIRLLDSVDPKFKEEFEKYRYKGHLPRFCMVWNGQLMQNPITKEHIIYYPWELGYGIRNKSTNIYRNGYGTSELETLVNIMTWVLWGFEYNANFFSKGSQPKGFINVKNQNIDNATLNEFRQAWTQTMKGVGNCLHGESFIITDQGGVEIQNLLKDKEEKNVLIWTGKKFEKALVYKTTEKKILNKMTLNNGTSVMSSPDHKFKVVSVEGVIEWKTRSQIVLGDFVLVNDQCIDSSKNKLEYKGKQVDSDLFEVIGWAIGDGWFGENLSRKKRMSTFYHSIKEEEVQKRHSEILNKYGINNSPREIFYKEEERVALQEKFDFGSVAKSRRETYIVDSEFLEWLFDLGFKSSKEGKEIPGFLYSYRADYRRAFLKGFFSADGSVINGKYIQMFITSNLLREQTKQLLLTEGIRCGNHEQNNYKDHFRGEIKPRMILLKDNKVFFDKIGFIQDHKQPVEGFENNKRQKTFPQSLAINIMKSIREHMKTNGIKYVGKYDSSTVNNLYTGKDKISKQALLRFAEKHGYKIEQEVLDFSFEEVINLEEFEEKLQMYDVEVFDDEHQFVVNGMISHNSHKVPVMQGIDLEWIDLQKGTNRDMEFNEWIKFLFIIVCSVYRIDPSELGFQFKEQTNVFGQDGQRERLDHSKEKGLKPLLIFFASIVNHYLVSEMFDGEFEFVFTGIEIEDEEKQVELDKKKTEAGFVSMEDMFLKYSGRKFKEETDTILNQVYQSAAATKQQQAMFGGDTAGGEEGVPNEEEDPFAQYGEDTEKALESNPILQTAFKYIDKNFKS